MIVVLAHPSLADRVAAAGGQASEDGRAPLDGAGARRAAAGRWRGSRARASGSARLQLRARAQRLLGGARPARARACSSATPEVAGVYPVRAAFPAARLARALEPGVRAARPGPDLRTARLSTAAASRSRCSTPASTATQPYLRGRVGRGLDVVDPDGDAPTRGRTRASRRELERHGTQLAGLLVGAAGPADCTASRRARRVLPIRVAGWQPDAEGGVVVYARTDQLIAGLERAVDPDGDGDAHDAARDRAGRRRRAVRRVRRQARRRGRSRARSRSTRSSSRRPGTTAPAGPRYGSSPARAARRPRSRSARRTSGRDDADGARRAPRAGSRSCSTASCRCGGAVAPPRTLELARRRSRAARRHGRGRPLDGSSTPRAQPRRRPRRARPSGTADPGAAARGGRAAGAPRCSSTAPLPAGALGLDERVGVPVVGVPHGPRRAARARARAGRRGRRLGRRAELGAERPRRPRRPVLLARARVRRRRQARPDRAGVGARARPTPARNDGRRSPRFATSAARAPRRRRRRRRGAARAGAAGARRGGAEAACSSATRGPGRGAPPTARAPAWSTSARRAAAELVAEPPTLALRRGRTARAGARRGRSRSGTSRRRRLDRRRVAAAGAATAGVARHG